MKMLTPQWVGEDLGVSNTTLAHWRVAGCGPKFVKLGPGPKAPVRYPEDHYLTYKRELFLRNSTSEVA
jgi:hypothetical protein